MPGSAEVWEGRPGQHLEKRYFEVGDLSFRVWRAFGGNIVLTATAGSITICCTNNNMDIDTSASVRAGSLNFTAANDISLSRHLNLSQPIQI